MHLSSRPVSFVTIASLGATSSTRLAVAGLLRIPQSTGTTTLSTATATPTPATVRQYATSVVATSTGGIAGGGEDDRGSSVEHQQQHTCVVSAALAFLEGKKQIVETLSPADYSAVDQVIGASVGAHMRHTLDHFAKCLETIFPSKAAAVPSAQEQEERKPAVARPQLDGRKVPIRYDHRIRGGTVETDPTEAAKVIANLQANLKALPRGRHGSLVLRKISVSPAFMLAAGDEEEHLFESNFERELFFCCHHGHHHDAMIRLILARMETTSDGARSLLDGKDNKNLGMAPSTAGFRKKQEQQRQQEGAGSDGTMK